VRELKGGDLRWPLTRKLIYTFETLRDATCEELVQQVNMLIKKAETDKTGGADRALPLFQAQLPMNELVRRDQDKQTRAMLRYTKWIWGMTLAIGAMTVIQLGLAWCDAKCPGLPAFFLNRPG
jgi:hypothetical protein